MSEDGQEISLLNLFVPLTTFKAIMLLVIAGILVYFNMLFNGFVWDDITYIAQNAQVHSLNLTYIFGPSLFNFPLAGYYRPVPALYFSLFYSLFHNITFMYHVSQLMLHIGNAILLFLLFQKFFHKNLSFVLALVFLVHPIQVESVSYISQADSPLFFIFGIGALLLSMKARVRLQNIVVIYSLLLLSILTKETGFLFLIMVFLYRALYQRKNIMQFAVFSVLILCIYFFMRFFIGHIYFTHITYDTPIGNITFAERMVTVPQVLFYYLKTFFYPMQLLIDQKWIITQMLFPTFYLPLMLDVLFFALLLLFGIACYKENRKKFSTYLFFLVWFALGIGMVSQLFSLDMTVADRWMYFPLAGLLGILGVGIQSLHFTTVRAKKISILLAVFIILLLSVRTIVRNANWYSEITLFSHDSQEVDSPDLEGYLAQEYLAENNFQEAVVHYREDVALNANEIDLSDLAHSYELEGNVKEANIYFLRTIESRNITPSVHAQVDKDAYQRLADLSLVTENASDAALLITMVLQKYPDSGNTWADLAVTEMRLRNHNAMMYASQKAKLYLPPDEYTILSHELQK